ncbi:MAG: hypothetical protein WCF06_02835 [Nitrososphaeraceae archaeon]
MDSENDIEEAAEKLARDEGWSKVKSLSTLHSKYQSENRLEEAVIVRRLIDKEESKAQSDTGFYAARPETTKKPRAPPSKKKSSKRIQQQGRTMNLTDVSKQLKKQTTQIDKIRLMLEVMQKQIRTSEKHPESIKQLQFQMKQLQKQVSQIQKNVERKR